MFKEMVVHCDDSNKIIIEEETYKKLWRLVKLITDAIKTNVFYDFKPIGLIVLIDDELDNFFYEIGQELKQKYPQLPLVYINKSLYKEKSRTYKK